MLKRSAVLAVLFSFIVLMAGCDTVMGACKGAAKGAAEGAKKDWQSAKKAEAWVQENLW